MDRNSLIGIILIGLIVVTFNYLNKPSQEEIQRQKELRDSIALVQQEQTIIEQIKVAETEESPKNIIPEIIQSNIPDSIKQQQLINEFGTFAKCTKGVKKEITVTTDLMTITFSNLGGKLQRVTLNNFITHDSIPIELFNENSTWGLTFNAERRILSSTDFYFNSADRDITIRGDEDKTITFKLEPLPGKFIEQSYTIRGNSYYIDYDITFIGLEDVLERDPNVQLNWKHQAQQQEKNLKYEKTQTCLLYHSTSGKMEHMSGTKKTQDVNIDDIEFNWVTFKHQFFSASIVNRNGFKFGKVKLINSPADKTSGKDIPIPNAFEAQLDLPYLESENYLIPLQLYFGPNDSKILKEANLGMQEIIPYGWGIFGYVNKLLIIPVFQFLSKFIPNYGIIIFILVILIKLLLSPLTYKSYLSTAKMKVLKPELAELKEKYGKDAARMQQEQMKLYSKAGVNPMGGCLPMLLQMPILFAMYRFFPSSIDLRQAGFLWANDLSTYDNIYDLPFNIQTI